MEQVVAERLARLEPRQCLEHGQLVVLRCRPWRGVLELDAATVGGSDTERDELTRLRGPREIGLRGHSSLLVGWEIFARLVPTEPPPAP